jgi:3-methyladenine DNA glycosylase AlkC
MDSTHVSISESDYMCITRTWWKKENTTIWILLHEFTNVVKKGKESTSNASREQYRACMASLYTITQMHASKQCVL